MARHDLVMRSNPARPARSRPKVSRAGRIVARRHALSTTHEPPRRRLAVRALATIVAAFGITAVFAVVMTAIIGATAVGVLSVDLPDPKRLDTLAFDQPTVVMDRSGTAELTRFQSVERRVVTFAEVPRPSTGTRRSTHPTRRRRTRRSRRITERAARGGIRPDRAPPSQHRSLQAG